MAENLNPSNVDQEPNSEKGEQSFTLSIYIDFTPEFKRKTGWELLPDGTVYDLKNINNGKHTIFDYDDVLIFLQRTVIPRLEKEIQLITNNRTIKVEYSDIRIGSIEIIFTIYGLYASINDFVETTKLLAGIVDRYTNANLSNRFGSNIFTNQTTFVTPLPVQPTNFGINLSSLMILITIIISISTFGVLFYFSYEFISNIFINITLFAVLLTLLIELSKITTTYYLTYEEIKNNSLNKSVVRFNRIVRFLAILLSGLFCLTQISQMNTAPNLEEIKKIKLSEIDNNYSTEYKYLTDTTKGENSILEKQLQPANKPTITTRFSSTDYSEIRNQNNLLNEQIKKNNENLETKLKELGEKKQNDINSIPNNLAQNPDVNNKRINTILSTVFDIQSNSENYSYWYKKFIIFSSLFITFLVELISIVSVQSLSRNLIK